MIKVFIYMRSRLIKAISLFSYLLLLLYSCWGSATAIENKNTQVKQAIIEAMNVFNIPGISVVVVENNQITLNQGYGVISIETSEKVTSDTLFGIASNTKAMTVALLAQLVDQYKISWQTKIVDILPEFKLYNPAVTQDFTLIDLLSHRSGLGYGAGDLMIWPNKTYTDKELYQGLPYLPQVSGFRTEFAYNNVMYIIAAKAIEKLTNKPFEQQIQSHLFQPLGMKNTWANISQYHAQITTQQALASPHIFANNKLTAINSHYLASFSAAGSVLSNANDMALWLKVLLNKGKLNTSKNLYSAPQAEVMWQPHTIRPVSDAAKKHDKTHFSAYGLGWFLNDFHGLKLVHHGGSMFGMVSQVALIPEKNIGVVLLANRQSSAALNALYREIFEAYLALPEKDWITYYHEEEKRKIERESSRLNRLESDLIKPSQPLLPLKSYAQTYIDKWYGEIIISLQGKKLAINFSKTPGLKGELVHYQDNQFIVRWDDRTLKADAYITFKTNADGNITQASLKAISYQTDFSFNFQDLKLLPQPIRVK